MNTQPLLPFPVPHGTDGAPRRVGIEFEYAELRVEDAVRAIRSAVGGEAVEHTPVEWTVRNTEIGDLDLELDLRALQEAARDAHAPEVPGWIAEISDWGTEILERVASIVVPWELVTGPMEPGELHRLDAVIAAMREAGAKGTRETPFYAFGVHLNPELPALDVETTTAYLKAYLCLKDWLRLRCRPDMARSLSPYISDFEDDYTAMVVDPGYRPSLARLIDDYVEANPTRNRSNDYLPLFMHIDEARVSAQLDDPLIGKRPTLHYRLPNCEIDDPLWSLRGIWEDWIQVELLAGDPQRLDHMGEEYIEWLDRFHLPFDNGWARQTPRWFV